MSNNTHILNELKELNSGLPHTSAPGYTVPAGYFENLAAQILSRIKALNTNDPKEELGYLSPMLANLEKTNPYRVSPGYFQGLGDEIMTRIAAEGMDHTSASEELESLSPLLSSLKKSNPYTVPEGYFEQLSTGTKKVEKQEAKVISFTRQKWFRYAAAAVVLAFVTLSGFWFFSPKSVNVNKNPEGWVAKNLKNVSTTEIQKYIQATDAGLTEAPEIPEVVAPKPDVNELLKDVSLSELESFVSQTDDGEEDDDVLFLN